MMRLNNACTVSIVALVFNAYAVAQERGTAKMRYAKQESVVVFVCEHGSAKSVIAAAHFNNLAQERNLKLRAISRGTNPDKEIAAKAVEGLRADGLAVGREKPKKLSGADVSRCIRLVAFCELPDAYSKGVRVEQWNDVPAVSEDYNRARDAIVERVRHLLDELRSAK
jgi:arsenate reductase (thioredoxin)